MISIIIHYLPFIIKYIIVLLNAVVSFESIIILGNPDTRRWVENDLKSGTLLSVFDDDAFIT